MRPVCDYRHSDLYYMMCYCCPSPVCGGIFLSLFHSVPFISILLAHLFSLSIETLICGVLMCSGTAALAAEVEGLGSLSSAASGMLPTPVEALPTEVLRL